MRDFKTRYNKNQKKLAAGIEIKPKGRPRKDITELPPSVRQLSKLTQLQYELASKERYSISEMCRYFEVSRSGYYDYVKRMDIPSKDLPLAKLIQECQDSCGKTYGYRRVHIWLEKKHIHYNLKTVLRVIMTTVL